MISGPRGRNSIAADGEVLVSGSALESLIARTGVSTASELAARNTTAAGAQSWDPGARDAGGALSGNVLPVHAELAELLPEYGLRRGSTVAVRGSTSLLLAVLATATAGGCWAAVVGMPELGVLAASEQGVAVHRLALIPRPGPEVGAVAAALLEGVDLVAVYPGSGIRPQLARRLCARARHHRSVLLPVGSWPGADLELRYVRGTWRGVDAGYGHLRARHAVVEARGRGAAARPARRTVLLPGVGGAVQAKPVPFAQSRPELGSPELGSPELGESELSRLELDRAKPVRASPARRATSGESFEVAG